MNALIFDGKLRFVRDYPTPRPPPGESLVRVLRAGICNTDLEIAKGYMGFSGVLGHEFVGIVEEGPLQGTRVVGEINAYCGECATCRRGDPTHCPQRSTLGIVKRDGAFADFLLLPSRNLHPVPSGVSDAQAVFTEPLAAACEITERVHVRPTDRVCVIGDGKLGLLCAQVLALTGCELVVLGHHAEKLAILEHLGIRATLDPNMLERGFDVLVECSGCAEGFELARQVVRPRGTIVAKSTFHGTQELTLAPIVIDEVTIAGSRCGPFEPALRLLEKKLVHVDALIDEEIPFGRALDGFERAAKPGALKVELVM